MPEWEELLRICCGLQDLFRTFLKKIGFSSEISRPMSLATSLNFPPRRLVLDRLFHCLIYLFEREEHDRPHADRASSTYGQRDGGRSRVVRHIKDEINVFFAEREIEHLQTSAQTLHHFLHHRTARCSTLLHEALHSLRGVGSLD